MWRIPLAFILVIAISYIFHRLGDHIDIAQDGGIRKKYNKVFSFIYNLPGSKISLETKSFVRFNVKTDKCDKVFTLSYNMDMLDIKCTITYKDDTAFNNGKSLKWTMGKKDSEEYLLQRITRDLSQLPN